VTVERKRAPKVFQQGKGRRKSVRGQQSLTNGGGETQNGKKNLSGVAT